MVPVYHRTLDNRGLQLEGRQYSSNAIPERQPGGLQGTPRREPQTRSVILSRALPDSPRAFSTARARRPLLGARGRGGGEKRSGA